MKHQCTQCDILGFTGLCPSLIGDEQAMRRHFVLNDPPKFTEPALVAAMAAEAARYRQEDAA